MSETSPRAVQIDQPAAQ